MKLPRLADRRASACSARDRAVGVVFSSSSYQLQTCTTNLGATRDGNRGHATLKHCLVHIKDEQGKPLRTFSIGRDGLGPEGNADVPSSRCDAPISGISEAQVSRFERSMQACADAGYEWGERDCCSCIERAFADGLEREAPAGVRGAAAELASVPDPLGGT
ncbi:MAG: hypothetical protein AAF799_37370 [Myxococcota bacterium]